MFFVKPAQSSGGFRMLVLVIRRPDRCRLLYNGLHDIPLPLHVGHQLELGSGAVQVLTGAVDGKVVVTVQIIRQEPDAVFQRHQLGAQRQRLTLHFCQTGTGLQEAFRKDAVQVRQEVNFGQILLVLRSG